MKIKCNNPATKTIVLPKFNRARVVFNHRGLATVSDQVGRFLTAKYSLIEEIKPEVKIEKKKDTAMHKQLPKEGD